MCHQNNELKYSQIHYIILFFAIFIIRALFFDSDLTPTSITQIYPLDEGFYSIPAFNLYHHSSFMYQLFPWIPDDGGNSNFLFTIFTYLSLNIFGNTFYGVRGGVYLLSFISIILFFCLLKKNRYNNALIICSIIYLAADFSFLSISRTATSTASRLPILLLLALVFNTKISSFKSFLLGFLSIFSIFFVYIYNLFILPVSFFTFIIYLYYQKDKQPLKKNLLFLLGASFALFCYQTYLILAFKTDLFTNYYHLYQVYSHRLSPTSSSFLVVLLQNISRNFTTNIFRLNLSLLYLFLIVLPLFIKKCFREKSIIDVFFGMMILFITLQSFFENSFHYRRLTIFLPVILFILIRSYQLLPEYLHHKKYRLYSIIMLLPPTLIFYFENIKNGLGAYLRPFYETLDIYFLIINLTVLIMIFLMVQFLNHSKNQFKIFLICLLLLPSLYLNATYIYSPTYYRKNAMKKMAPMINDQITVGQTSFSFRFYNRSKPILNIYSYQNQKDLYIKYFNQLFSNDEIYFTIDQNRKQNDQFDFHIKDVWKNKRFHIGNIDLLYGGEGVHILLFKKYTAGKPTKEHFGFNKKYQCQQGIQNLLKLSDQLQYPSNKIAIKKREQYYKEQINRTPELSQQLKNCMNNYSSNKRTCLINAISLNQIKQCLKQK